MKEKALKYYSYALFLLVFLLPHYQKLIPPAIILLAITSFFTGFNYAVLFKNKTAVFFLIFYLLYLTGILYTENIHEGQFDLEVKLSMIVFPVVLFPVHKLSLKQISHVGSFFVLGCVLAVSICLGIGAYNYFMELYLKSNNLYNLDNGVNWLLSARLSCFMHPSYFSMNLSLALCIVLFKNDVFLNRNLIRWIVVLLFFVTIILLASKVGIFVLGLIALIYLIHLKSIKYAIIIVSVFALFFVTLFIMAPEFAGRFTGFASAVSEEQVDKTTVESSSARILVWESALDVIVNNPFYGSGTGDVKNELMQYYKKNNYSGLLKNELNAHNQFLQTTLAIGYVGLLTFLGILVFNLLYVIKNRSVIGILTVIIIVSNIMVESMLETQAGVVFLTFWLLFESYKKPTIA